MTRYQRKALSNMIGWAVVALMSYVGALEGRHDWLTLVLVVSTVFCLWRMGVCQRIFDGDESP